LPALRLNHSGAGSSGHPLPQGERGNAYLPFPLLAPNSLPMTNSSLALAETRLLLPAGLDQQGLHRAFGTLLGPGIAFGDLYFQNTRRESWTVEDGIVKDGAHRTDQGVGERAISSEKTGFAYSADINPQAMLSAAGSARAITRDGSSHAP